jgi:hypothetical protein
LKDATLPLVDCYLVLEFCANIDELLSEPFLVFMELQEKEDESSISMKEIK